MMKKQVLKYRLAQFPFMLCFIAVITLFWNFNIISSAKASSISLNKTSVNLYINGSITLKATVSGSNKKVTWSTSNKKIAIVKSGKVTAKKAGTCTITAKANGKTSTCKITVKNPSIKLNKTKVTLDMSETSSVTLKATVKGTSSKVTWSISDKKIATVKNGKVTAKKAGTCTVTAKANGKTAKCKVTVKKNKELTKKEQHRLYEATIKSYDKKMKEGALKYASWGDNEGQATYFAFADIDGNGTDELILHYENTSFQYHRTNTSSGYGENTFIYTIIDKKVKLVLNNGSEDGSYCPSFEHRNFIHVYKGSNLINKGFSHFPLDDAFYKYSNGHIASSASLTLTRGGNIWMINNQNSTAEKCIKEFNKASNKDTGYNMHRYSASTYKNYI